MPKNTAYNIWLAMVVFAFMITGCTALRSDTKIIVPFDDTVQGLQSGDKVYLFGVPVGEVENPLIINGRPSVPVVIQNVGVFGQDREVLFYIAPDLARPGRQSLVAVIQQVPVEPNKPRFRGFSSKTKVMLQTRVEKIESWWNSLGISK